MPSSINRVQAGTLLIEDRFLGTSFESECPSTGLRAAGKDAANNSIFLRAEFSNGSSSKREFS